MSVSLDKLAAALIFSGLTLLFLPDRFLLSWQTACYLLLLLCPLMLLAYALRQDKIKQIVMWLLILMIQSAYVHQSAISILTQADNLANLPKTVHREFTVEEILHQQHYQTLVIRAKLAENLPEQRIYAQWKLKQSVNPGERYAGNLRLRALSSRLNFDGFDRQPWYFGKHITAWAEIKSAVKLENVFSLRQTALNQALQQTENLPRQGLLLALGFGERFRLDQKTWQIYQKTNTAHLIAISGLHIGLAMMLGFTLARLLQFALPTRYISPTFPILCGFIFALLYSQLAGLAIPTLRAMIALAMLYAIQYWRRYWTVWQFLLRVVALLIFIDPLMLLSTSFWLSVGTVTCLIVWYQYFPLSLLQWRDHSLANSPWRKVRYVFGLFHLQFGLLWLFTPIQLLFFNGISLNSFIANVIAVPLYSFVLVPLVLFAVVIQGVWHSWQLANDLAEKITALLTPWQDDWLAISIPHSLWITLCLTFLFLVALYVIYKPPKPITSTLALSRQHRFKGFHFNPERALSLPLRKSACCVGGGLIALCCLTLISQSISRPNWQLETLDVGQGLATLIVKDGKGVLYDTGPSWKGGSMAQLEILPYLQRQGIDLEWLILSHDDNDHAGGAKDILAMYPHIQLTTASQKRYGSQNTEKNDRTFCQAGKQWHWQGLHFTVLSPENIVPRAENPDSCTLLLTDGTHHILLTGDADLSVEYKILPKLGKIHVLQVGHHGSKTSTGQALVQHIQPDIALISSGRWNPWHFPHKDVVAHLQQQGSQIYNTAHSGQISLLFYNDEIKIQTARAEFSPWYRRLIGLSTK
ncbi:DNA internalization-related competence protein ComEC/Rec2 [Aggregatibacter actinomycetemcomitans]|uniref:DNA internalization-related competence protein ComEC/Rec2 n=1 Tax=Aggregatibacter actinomycetemcomitans TaxID=714 RepID=UPI00197BFE61|nr:DNA internalization-related competence protein ComEC/Rec2 [Aggregatibacter actinomycetemcomitans]MBN6068657.1 DNA internalization-related competence protein ComEC/Rec2 [Aggregatibacter actinomycetemcomitans]MBN6085148.1 DNA internalization-related competence protein ComEC/Rec2 [Aggregatibacter actinomycetemcomitans]